MKTIKKFLAVVSAFALCTALVSCDKKGTAVTDTDNIPDSYYVDEEFLPYGATLVEIKEGNDENLKTTIEFDRRFFEEKDGKYEEIYKVADYMYALANKDEELLKNTMYPPFLQYMSESSGSETTKDYIESSYKSLADLFGGDFQFSYIDITDCISDTDEGSESAFEGIAEILDANTGEKVSDRITSMKQVTIEGMTMYSLEDGSSHVMINKTQQAMILYILEIDGQYYIV